VFIRHLGAPEEQRGYNQTREVNPPYGFQPRLIGPYNPTLQLKECYDRTNDVSRYCPP